MASIRVYACGGAGTNQLKPVYGTAVSDKEGLAPLQLTFVDTSNSNLEDHVSDEDIYLLKNVDGSGKLRKENHGEISNTVKEVLLKHQPTEFNIIVYSTSGGSGSVIGPLLHRELLLRNIPVISIVTGTTGTAIEAQNNVNTLKSMDNIARKSDKPFVVSYEQNSAKFPRSEVNKLVLETVVALQQLVGAIGNNSGLDTSDIQNWLYYNRVTDVPAQLALMEVIPTQDVADDVGEIISLASILVGDDEPELSITADYGTEARVHNLSSVKELHFGIGVANVRELFDMANDKSETYAERKKSRPTTTALADNNDSLTDNDLVL